MATDYKTVFQLAQNKGYKFNKVDVRTILLRLKLLSTKQRKREIYLYLCEIQKWLRDEHKISIEVNSTLDSLINGNPEYHFGASKWGNKKNYKCGSNFPSYESALLEGIYEALKLI